MSISAHGTTPGTAIVWTSYSTILGTENGAPNPGILQAFDASNLANELWDSNQNSGRDSSGEWAKWSPPTVANGKVYLGSFSNQLTVYGLLNASLPTLQGVGDSSSAAVNLTSEGNVDWVHWGDGVLNRKGGVTPQISDFTALGSGTALPFSTDPRPISWTDGTPTANNTADTSGVYISGTPQGFSFTAPADTTADGQSTK